MNLLKELYEMFKINLVINTLNESELEIIEKIEEKLSIPKEDRVNY